MAGDVMTTATAGAGETARIGESADSAQLNGQDHGETDQVTATRPQTGAPASQQLSPGETTPRTPRGVSDGEASAPDTRPATTARPTRQTRQGLAPAAQPVPPGAGVRRRLARLGAQRGSNVNPVLEPLIKTIRAHHPKADVRTVERAYEVAAHWHKDQKRKSGDPYITHPLAVATILAELGMNTETICAALLHDTVEDTAYTLNELRSEFGEDVAALVDGVTKLDKVKYGASAEAETVRKMVVAMSRDIRVLVIKLADRLHNMRTLRYMPRDKQERKSRETLEIYAPLAHRLGMNTVKWELEDLAFATLYPKRYDEIARLVSQRSPRRDHLLQEVIESLSADMHEARIKGTVTGRPKHYYSIYQKMIARNVEFDDIYDLVGIRVLVDTVRDCYAALGTIHARWNPVPGRFKDYVAMPKFNMYQSLHTTVIGPGGKPVELQIRTWGMHKRAEYGVAAHWKYKEDMHAHGPALASGNPGKAGTKAEAKANQDAAEMVWLRQLVDWQRETEDPAKQYDELNKVRNMARDPSIAEVANECGLSASYFCRAFKQATGVPPYRWLIKQRVERAKELLPGAAPGARRDRPALRLRRPKPLHPGFFQERGLQSGAPAPPPSHLRRVVCGLRRKTPCPRQRRCRPEFSYGHASLFGLALSQKLPRPSPAGASIMGSEAVAPGLVVNGSRGI